LLVWDLVWIVVSEIVDVVYVVYVVRVGIEFVWVIEGTVGV
jgi:hypothetical protein